MCKRCRYQKGRNQERGDRRSRDIGVRVCDIVEHAQIEQWVRKAQHASRDDRRPERRSAVRGKRKPEQRDGEQPDRHEGGKKAGFRPALPTVLDAVSLEEVRLEGHEAKHDDDADKEVEKRLVRLQRGEAVVEGEDFEDAIEV